MHVIAAKAVAFGEALRPSFKAYQKAVRANAVALADQLVKARVGYRHGWHGYAFNAGGFAPEIGDGEYRGCGAWAGEHHL